MGMEALSALRQLTQVREEAASNQNDKLEQVQQSVQQTSVSETGRVDNLNLEKLKTEYEVALSAARVERLQSQLERQEKAVLFQSIGLIASGGIALGDSIMNIAKDLKGGQKFGDANQGNKTDKDDFKDATTLVDAGAGGVNANVYSAGKMQDYDLFLGGGKELNYANAQKLGLIQEDEKGGFSLTDDGQKFGLQLKTDPKGGGPINQIDVEKSFAGIKSFAEKNPGLGITASGDNVSLKAQSIARSSIAGNGSQSFITVGVIRQDQIEAKSKGAGSFEGLFGKDKAAANSLYNDLARDVKKSEVSSVTSTLRGSIVFSASSANATGEKLSSEKANKASQDIDGFFKMAGKKDDKKNLQSILGGVISFANVVVPQFQALLKAKSDVEDTKIELQAAQEKMAAAAKKLKQIEAIIHNAGSAGDQGQSLGNAN